MDRVIDFTDISVDEFLVKACPYIENGLIIASHYRDYCIMRYGIQAEIQGVWDSMTMTCRTIIVDVANREVVARSFGKFFNVNQNEYYRLQDFPNEPFVYTTKEDGWLGLLFYDKHLSKWGIATRSTFYNPTISWLNDNLQDYIDTSHLSPDSQYSHVFEIISPETKVIVDYGDMRKVVYLAAVDKLTGEPIFDQSILNGFADVMNVELVKFHRINTTLEESISSIAANMNQDDGEGYVIRFQNGLWVKAKNKWYLDTARIMQHCSPTTIWKKYDCALQRVDPAFVNRIKYIAVDEVRDEVLGQIRELETKIKNILDAAYVIFWENSQSRIKKDFVLRLMEDSRVKESRHLFNIAISLFDNNEKKAAIQAHRIMRPGLECQ